MIGRFVNVETGWWSVFIFQKGSSCLSFAASCKYCRTKTSTCFLEQMQECG